VSHVHPRSMKHAVLGVNDVRRQPYISRNGVSASSQSAT
jgi:hypothetical protein